MTVLIRDGMAARTADGTLKNMPPIVAFQSVVDSTITMPTLVTGLFAQLPANGSELVLFDMNRDTVFLPLLNTGAAPNLDTLMGRGPRNYAYTLITNKGDARQVVAETTPAGATSPDGRLRWVSNGRAKSSRSAISPSRSRSMTGFTARCPTRPTTRASSWARWRCAANAACWWCRPTLLMRISANPFFPYMMQRIEAGIAPAR